MNSSDDTGIIIEESRNLSDDAIEIDDTTQESVDVLGRTMKDQGIAIEVDYTGAEATAKNLDTFSRELLDQGGIEIVSSEEGEEHYQ